MLARHHGYHWGIMGCVPIPEWSDDDIEDLERHDVHGSRCRCQYCKDRLDVIAVDRAFAAQRKADKQAEEDQARRWEAEREIRERDAAAIKQVEDEIAGMRREIRKLRAEIISGDDCLRFLEYDAAWAKFRPTG